MPKKRGESSEPEKPRLCPHCGHGVRADERFCDNCGKPLSSTAGPPPQPSTPAPSPLSSTSEPRQSSAAPAPTTLGKNPIVLVVGCAALLVMGTIGFCVFGIGGLALLGGDSTPSAGARPSRTPTSALPAHLRAALLGSVIVIAPDDSGNPYMRGSGTIVTPQGHILTNLHIMADENTGKFYNQQGLAYVGINPPDLQGRPSTIYLAQTIKFDRSQDLALLRIVATEKGGPLPLDLKLTVVPLGNSDTVQFGDEVSVLGFPSLGEWTVTLTKGTVSGYLTDADTAGTWIKTDTEINPGNSGGAAINKAGQLVGIPTADVTNKAYIGKLGLLRPVNSALPLIQLAQRDAQSPVNFTFVPWRPSRTEPAPKPSIASFGQIGFCDTFKDGKPVNPRTSFPAGTQMVTAYWTNQDVAKGQPWGYRWLANGQVVYEKPNLTWEYDSTGSSWASLSGQGTPLPSGTWEFVLYLGGKEVQRATFSVGR